MSDHPTTSTTSPEAAHLGRALEMAKKINDKAATLLLPLEREMRIMQWAPEYRAIMWEAVLLAAKERLEACDEH